VVEWMLRFSKIKHKLSERRREVIKTLVKRFPNGKIGERRRKVVNWLIEIPHLMQRECFEGWWEMGDRLIIKKALEFQEY
jgi:uncharacterized protein YggL (DUF469 family)